MEKAITNPVTYIRQTVQLKTELEKTFILLAERLYNIFTQRLWESEHGSWEEFLMELKMSSPAASKLMSVYKKYVVELEIPQSKLAAVRSWESLYSVRSLATDREKGIELVEAGAVESDKDMRAKVNGEVECDRHSWFEYRACSNCGKREKIYNN